MTTNKINEEQEDRENILKEIKELENDLSDYNKSLTDYYAIPDKAEVGEDYHEMIKALEDVAKTIEELPKKYKNK